MELRTIKKISNIDFDTIKFSYKNSLSVFLGYIPIGIAFGLLTVKAGYPFIIAPLMSLIIYAGAAQFLSIKLFATNANLSEIALFILLVNSRHIVYGLSFLQKYNVSGWIKPYLIFTLTDETFAILTSIKYPETINKRKAYIYISALNHIYWIIGTIIGALCGNLIPFDLTGLDFALTALFIVLLIEQIKSHHERSHFLIALLCSIVSFVIAGKDNMLLIAILSSIITLVLIKKILNNKGRNNEY